MKSSRQIKVIFETLIFIFLWYQTTSSSLFTLSALIIYITSLTSYIIETLYVTIPALTNIGGLLLLFLYIFSVLGVFLFAEVQLQTNLEIHANFQSFGLAFLTLIRCSTGEAWNYIMADTVRQRSITFQCSEDDFDFERYQ